MCYNELYLKRDEEVWRVASRHTQRELPLGCKQFCVGKNAFRFRAERMKLYVVRYGEKAPLHAL